MPNNLILQKQAMKCGLTDVEFEKYQGKWVAVTKGESEVVSFSGDTLAEVGTKVINDNKNLGSFNFFRLSSLFQKTKGR